MASRFVVLDSMYEAQRMHKAGLLYYLGHDVDAATSTLIRTKWIPIDYDDQGPQKNELEHGWLAYLVEDDGDG